MSQPGVFVVFGQQDANIISWMIVNTSKELCYKYSLIVGNC